MAMVIDLDDLYVFDVRLTYRNAAPVKLIVLARNYPEALSKAMNREKGVIPETPLTVTMGETARVDIQ
jgi:hypothetical protein